MLEKIKGFMQLNTGAAAAFAIGKAVLALSKDEALDQVTASVNCPGAAHIEVKYGTETGVYGDPVRVENSSYSWVTEDEALFVVARGIACDGTAGAWSDEATITLNVNDFLTFTLPGQTGASVIDTVAGTIAVTVPHGTNVEAMIPTFTVSAGASVECGAAPLVSGVTELDLSDPVLCAVQGQNDGPIQEYTITVTVAAATNHITAFSLAEQTGAAVISTEAHTVAIEVANGTNPAALVATFTLSAGASASVGETPQVSGVTANDFTLPVVYTVVGADAAEQAWTVTVTIAV